MAASSILIVSVILVAYAEIRSAARIYQQQLAFRAVQVDLVNAMLVIQHEQMGSLARRIAADSQVDAVFNFEPADLETVLDAAREGLRIALDVIDSSGTNLASSAHLTARVDGIPPPPAGMDLAETRLVTTSDGAPVLLHHSPIRRGDRVVGVVRALLPLVSVTGDFFPGLAGLAFRPTDGSLKPLSGVIPEMADIPPDELVTVVTGDLRTRFQAVFIPLGFGEGGDIGELILLRDITRTVQIDELFSSLTIVTVSIIILISLGILTRYLRLGFRPLGATVHLLDAMSHGDTRLQLRRTAEAPSPDPEKNGTKDPTDAGEGESRHEIDTLLSTVESFRASIDAQNTLIAVRQQLDNARRIQQSLLPRSFDLHPKLEIFGKMRPALEVAGDFFDIFKLEDGRIAVLIADVSGKGLAPALFAAQASALLRAQTHQHIDPADIIGLANQALCERNPEDMFLTAFLALITPETGSVSFVNAGHCAPVIIRQSGEVEQIVTDPELILGVMPEFTWTRHQMDVNPGDRVLLYSDGFDEAQTLAGELLGTEKVVSMFTEAGADGNLSSERISDILFEGIDRFSAGAPQADDITIITIKSLG